MRQIIKCYDVSVRTVGPVFIGSGREITKKEYVFLRSGEQVGILDPQAFYQFLRRKGKAAEYERFLLGSGRNDLYGWLREQNLKTMDIEPYFRYKLDCGDAIREKGGKLTVLECIKDAYGMPYVPGSSLKGMFRTILLADEILAEPEHYRGEAIALQRDADAPGRQNKNQYLKRNIMGAEAKRFRTLNREGGPKPTDAVNDTLQGFIVSDSEPLSCKDLVLCQKVDVHTDGSQRSLPILRECIRPETVIRFTLTVDHSVCRVTERDIQSAIAAFAKSYQENFTDAFRVNRMTDDRTIYLGGGTGFVSKTVVYPLLGRQNGIRTTQKIFEKTGVPWKHKHETDARLGVSPHTLKCTTCDGRLLQMGMCRLETIEMRG